MASVAFQGFRPELIEILRNLGANTNRAWFAPHRLGYERYRLDPARELVVAMGECLPKLGADSHAEPRVRGSILVIDERLAPRQQWLVDILPS